jgi:subtilisin family serine protease
MGIDRRVWIAGGLGLVLALAGSLPSIDGRPLDPEAAALASIHRDQANHLAFLGVDRWQLTGYRGQGIKIAILDTGFRGYRDYLGKTLPARVVTHCFRDDGNFEGKNSQHGVLCAEVVHALAPEAELLLTTWEPDSSERFLEAVRWAKGAGARIISCSVLMPSWSDGDGGGDFHQNLSRILQSRTNSPEGALASRPDVGVACFRGLPAFLWGIEVLPGRESMAPSNGSGSTDALFFACAGNTALRHWTGRFHAGADGFHEWQPGQTINNLRPWNSDRVSVELYGPAATQYEITARDENGEEVSRSKPVAGTNGSSIAARFLPQPQSTYQVQVRLKKGKPGNFHLVVLGGTLSTVTSQGSVACPADGTEVIAVGAVTRAGSRLDYSSCGLDTHALKPDFVAPVPFPTTVRPQPFTGTSAAAPQAAAVAALLWSRHPQWTAEQIRKVLTTSARDVGAPGPDCETGFGMIALPEAP